MYKVSVVIGFLYDIFYVNFMWVFFLYEVYVEIFKLINFIIVIYIYGILNYVLYWVLWVWYICIK